MQNGSIRRKPHQKNTVEWMKRREKPPPRSIITLEQNPDQ
jgi:hypothetical protein